MLAHAIHLAQTPPTGPVFVSLPMDDMDVELDGKQVADIRVLRDRTVVASNAEYGILKQFGVLEHTPGVPGLDLPGLDVVATAISYGVDAHTAHDTDELASLLRSGTADRERPTLINIRTTKVSV
ncbi:hypothetical protein ACMATS_33985 [Streptoverticillium reticulum]|uniref:hypothetical protein n=1 Tax=Streptoverticillium reticulum TaxID=1433415 RepID=UPI0039BF4863